MSIKLCEEMTRTQMEQLKSGVRRIHVDRDGRCVVTDSAGLRRGTGRSPREAFEALR
jgi:hypothetical protein